jgi:hypothetical protein
MNFYLTYMEIDGRGCVVRTPDDFTPGRHKPAVSFSSDPAMRRYVCMQFLVPS